MSATVEIVSINSTNLILDQKDFDVAIIIEEKMESHRALFNDFLKSFTGTMIHIGDPTYKNDPEKFVGCSDIIDWSFEKSDIHIPAVEIDDQSDNWGANQTYTFQFRGNFIDEITEILQAALDKSPVKRIFFLTDYQFGPANPKFEIIYSISEFLELHEKEGLEWNKLYEMYA